MTITTAIPSTRESYIPADVLAARDFYEYRALRLEAEVARLRLENDALRAGRGAS
ncbi:hypothetical protein [Streptomyces sp.]|uniref:hypothetical protein n=1 Tax=Streptomyces sp. TaxID=1931 RepID=UPI002F94D778